MDDRSFSNIQRFLVASAAVVVLLYGIRMAAPILSPFLLAIVLAFTVVPIPNWFVHRFKVRKSIAIVLTLVVVLTIGVVLLVGVGEAALRLKAQLPAYHERFAALHQEVNGFIESQGLDPAAISPLKRLTPDRMISLSTQVLQALGGIISEGAVVLMIFAFLLIEIAESGTEQRSRFAGAFGYYGADIQHYMGITAETGALNAVANLLILLALGVDFPLLWCVLYFFLNFIPTLGFMIALVPPTLLALLTHGWHAALAVAVGFILTNTIVDNLVKPIFMKKGMDVSFLSTILSLVFWAFLLGSVGAILAIPLTLAAEKFLRRRAEGHSFFSAGTEPAPGG